MGGGKKKRVEEYLGGHYLNRGRKIGKRSCAGKKRGERGRRAIARGKLVNL